MLVVSCLPYSAFVEVFTGQVIPHEAIQRVCCIFEGSGIVYWGVDQRDALKLKCPGVNLPTRSKAVRPLFADVAKVKTELKSMRSLHPTNGVRKTRGASLAPLS